MRRQSDLITIILPTCNTRREYLLCAINSILAQSYRKFELIIINDGGREDKEVVKSLRDSRIKIIDHEKSRGIAASLNEAISVAGGKYIMRMDADDYALPNRIMTQYNFMESHPDIDICSTYAKFFGDKHSIEGAPFTKNSYLKSELFISNVFIHPAVMFRKTSIDRFDIRYDETFIYAQDYELWSRLSRETECRFAVIPRVCLFYRSHRNQISFNRSSTQRKFYDLAGRNNLQYLGVNLKNGDAERCLTALRGRGGSVSIESMRKFINECIIRNNEAEVYDPKTFKRIMRKDLFMQENKFKKNVVIAIRAIRRPYVLIFYSEKFLLKCRAFLSVIRYYWLYKRINKED